MEFKPEIKINSKLELKIFQKTDAPQLFALVDVNRNHLAHWLSWVKSTLSVKDSENFIENSLAQFQKNEAPTYGIWVEGNLAGVISFHKIDWKNRKTKIGYWIAQDYQGKGLTITSCRKLTDYGFKDLKLNRIAIYCATDNLRSQAIPKKLGFSQEGILKSSEWLYDHFVDQVVYAMLADQWRN